MAGPTRPNQTAAAGQPGSSLNLDVEKAALRAGVRAALRDLTAAGRRAASAAVCQALQARLFPTANRLLVYAPTPEEVDVWPLVMAGLFSAKRIALPAFNLQTGEYEARQISDLTADLVTGKFGIREPAPHCPRLEPQQVDWILVPGVAFDRQGNRLGRGRGFYDRLLAQVKGRRCGVAFDQQILPAVPGAAHDQRMDALATPSGWWECPA